jgi:hypothetical protein
MKRTTIVASSAFAATGAFTAALILTPFIAKHTSWIAEEVPAHTITAKAEDDRQLQTASFVVAFLNTSLDLQYETPVRKGSSARVTATINQRQVYRRDPSYPSDGNDIPEPIQFDTLSWPIELKLTSAAFRFSSAEEERKPSPEAHLPLVIVWAPIADSEGDSNFILHLTNFNGARSGRGNFMNSSDFISININGTTRAFGVDDDVPLPISVYTVQGMPAWLWSDLTVGGAIVTFVFGSTLLLGWFSRLWAWIAGNPAKKARQHRGRSHF